MAKSCNIILISDDSSIEELMSLRLIPLREMDSLRTITYKEGFEEDLGRPEVILIYCNDDKEKRDECIELIRHLRSNEKNFSTSIMIIVDSFNREFIIKAYSELIDDFILKDSEKGSTLIKLMWALKQSGLNKELQKKQDFLCDLGVIDRKTGFYVAEIREKIFNHEIEYLDTQNGTNSLMLIGVSEDGKSTFDYDELVNTVKTFLRGTDIIFKGLNEKIYVLLPNTPLNTIGIIFKKISTNLKNPKSIICSASDIKGKSFSVLETALLSNLSKAEFSDENYVVVTEMPLEVEELKDESWQHWMDQNLGTPKNFKLFKKTYTNKLQTIIVPTFFQTQKKYENKFFEVEIENVIGETTSKFIMKKGNDVSELQINYNGFSKINVNIVHSGLDSPENKNFDIDLSHITEENITNIVEEFVKTFQEAYC